MKFSDMVGHASKSLRKRRGFTQSELAHIMGISDRTISMIETNRTSASLETLEYMMRALSVSPREFFDFDMEEQANGPRVERLAALADVARNLSDEGLALALGILEVIEEREKGDED
ncbi:MAG: helix-turn-helix transcriptional regulator [Pseudomonadota bacterium]